MSSARDKANLAKAKAIAASMAPAIVIQCDRMANGQTPVAVTTTDAAFIATIQPTGTNSVTTLCGSNGLTGANSPGTVGANVPANCTPTFMAQGAGVVWSGTGC